MTAARSVAATFNGVDTPGAFNKTAPIDGVAGQSTSPTLIWGVSAGAASYEYCYDTTNDSACTGSWTSTGAVTSANLSALGNNITYYWQVRARNGAGTTDADGGTWWSFTTEDLPLGTWADTASLNTARQVHAVAVWADRIYVLGGESASGLLTSIESATINADGTLTPWQVIGHLTSARREHKAIAVNGYLYVVGGDNGSNALSTVEYAEINPDGTLGAWQTTNSLGTARMWLGLTAGNGFIYAIGGGNPAALSSVEYAPIAADGSLGAWQTTNPLNSARGGMDAVMAGGYIYVPSGQNGSERPLTVEYAAIQSDGSLAPWGRTSSVNPPRSGHATVTDGLSVYMIGGSAYENNTGLPNVEVAAINPNHTLGA